MHPTRDTTARIDINRAGRRVMAGGKRCEQGTLFSGS
jgi:hypothetical protein